MIMNQDASLSTEQTPLPPPPPPPHSSKRPLWLLGLLLITAAVASGYSGWQQWSTMQWQLQQLLQQVTALQAQVQTLEAHSGQPTQKLKSLEIQISTLTQHQRQFQEDLAAVAYQARQPRDDSDWLMAEIAYLLTIASERFTVAKDPDSALLALLAADERLRRLNLPVLLPVRTQLAQDINRVRAYRQIDVSGMAMRLANYTEQVTKLPLVHLARPADTSAPEMPMTPTVSAAVVTQLKRLVALRYNADATPGLVTTAQRDLIVQSVQLQFQVARLALLNRDNDNFKASLQLLRTWLKRYYDQNHHTVKVIQEDLAVMQPVVLTTPPPDISTALTLLERLSTTVLIPPPETLE